MPSEFSLIERYFTRPTPKSVLGVGDDAAIVRPTTDREGLVSTDMLVSGTHFLPDTEPTSLGWKTLAVNLSDMAAMGALPRWALLALALPPERAKDEAWLSAFSQGFFECAETFGVELIGGDTTRGPLNFCVTIYGEAPRGQALRRDGARPDDEIWISGTPGCAALGLAHLQGRCQLNEENRQYCLDALHRPQPRVALGLALRKQSLATAALDVSDGLLADLGHLLTRSNVAATVFFNRLPTAALLCGVTPELAQDCLLAGGDDYELLFTAPPIHHERIVALGQELGLPLSCIGKIETPSTLSVPSTSPLLSPPAASLLLQDASGQPMSLGRRGYDHFDAGAHT